MQRWVSIVLGVVVMGLAIALAWQGMSHWHPPKLEPDASTNGGAERDGSLFVFDFDASFEPAAPREMRDGGAGYTMPDGTFPPPLGPGMPRLVRFGVVLVTYAGAEDAPRGARSKRDALDMAQKLAAQAKSDFHAAVRRGDDGSGDDVGSMRRGVLEPAPEYVLFSLPASGVSDPIDTPRGYWIVKRIE